ncbi:MAG: prepilin peptidase, partial [Blautia sp.]|nr:prepilin peptidase [Blautia sp.]
MWFRITFSMTAAFVAMVMDLRTGCVDNGWLVFCMIISLVFNGMEKGAAGVGFFALGMVFPFIMLWFLFLFHMLGAGDIKLFCVLGGLLGVHSIGVCVAVS